MSGGTFRAGATVLYTLNPAMPVLLRPDGMVQVGWDPRRAVLVQPPAGLTAADLVGLLRAMQSRCAMADLRSRAVAAGLFDPGALADLVRQLATAGLVRRQHRVRRTRASLVRVHGRGPLSDLLVSGLACSGARVRHSNHRNSDVTADGADLVLLSDYLVADPRLLRDLHAAGTPHLPVRVRDGTGLVGPMVIPGVTSCLGCADLHRSDHDAAWPAVAAQLRDTVGTADRATVLATAAVALGQVDRVLRAVDEIGGPDRSDPPPTLDTTLEVDVARSAILARRWSRHPRCSC